MRKLKGLLHSLVLRSAFCAQGEHKRETVESRLGLLHYRCVDCGNVRELGLVSPFGSNHKVEQWWSDHHAD